MYLKHRMSQDQTFRNLTMETAHAAVPSYAKIRCGPITEFRVLTNSATRMWHMLTSESLGT